MRPDIGEHPPGQVLTAEDIIWRRRQPVLPLGVDGHRTHLPLKKIENNGADPIWLAWFNPLDSATGEIGAFMMAPLVALLSPGAAVQPPSSKSVEMVARAVRQAQEQTGSRIPLLTLLGDTDEKSLREKLRAAGVPEAELEQWYRFCQPITGKKKFIGLTPPMLAQLTKAARSDQEICLLDDVYSTGATMGVARDLISSGLARQGVKLAPLDIPVVVAAIEVEGPYSDEKHRQAFNVWAAAVIPVLSGNLE